MLLWAVTALAVSLGASSAHVSASSPPRKEPIQLHVVPHTHDDVGWLKTVDQYYYGLNNSIQHAGVQYIIDSVINALQHDPNKKFTYVEQAFFQRWMRQQSDDTRHSVKQLVANGQLYFVNGGWCMHDEATAHYIDMIDQTTLGHRYLKQQFDFVPKIAWQIDPFGHSATQASLLGYEAGFDGLYFARIDDEDHDRRLASKDLEFVWQASAVQGSSNQIFTGAFQSGNYGPVPWFCFDQFCNDEPIADDPSLDDYNVDSRVNEFVTYIEDLAAHQKDNIVMTTVGMDFQWENALSSYKNLDKLINAVNEDGRVHAFYSNPYTYTVAKNQRDTTYSVKTDDFFPYADGRHAYWTGYFSSRPSLKRQVRESSNWLNALKQIAVLTNSESQSLQQLMEAQGVAQHHDAVSGTAKQHVTYDYSKRLSRGLNTALHTLTQALSQNIADEGEPVPLETCLQLNISVCEATQHVDDTHSIAIIVYNPAAHEVQTTVTLPITSSNSMLSVLDGSLKAVAAQISPVSEHALQQLQETYRALSISDAATHAVTFAVSLPALGFSTYFLGTPASLQLSEPLRSSSTSYAALSSFQMPSRTDEEQQTIENTFWRVTFDTTTGSIQSVTDLHSGTTHQFEQEFMYYRACATGEQCPEDANQRAGAYLFRPIEHDAQPVTIDSPSVSFSRGDVKQEAHQRINQWLSQVVRLTQGSKVIEFEWTVGSVDVSDGYGKEIVTRYTVPDIQSSAELYTDSNGREILRRIRDVKSGYKQKDRSEPTASNIYPVNTMAYINDTNLQLSVLVDRSEGAASLHDGELEFLIHRRLLADDDRGVAESLDETQSVEHRPFKRVGEGIVVTGTHRVTLTSPSSAAAVTKPLAHQIYAQPLPFFAPLPTGMSVKDYISSHATTATALVKELPANVDLITLEHTGTESTVIIRLAHQFAPGEDAQLSQPVTLDLDGLFVDSLQLSNINEVSLSANQDADQLADRRLKWKTVDADAVQATPQRAILETGTSVIILQPMEIKTFTADLRIRPGNNAQLRHPRLDNDSIFSPPLLAIQRAAGRLSQ